VLKQIFTQACTSQDLFSVFIVWWSHRLLCLSHTSLYKTDESCDVLCCVLFILPDMKRRYLKWHRYLDFAQKYLLSNLDFFPQCGTKSCPGNIILTLILKTGAGNVWSVIYFKEEKLSVSSQNERLFWWVYDSMEGRLNITDTSGVVFF
jgi:hypothetical protein